MQQQPELRLLGGGLDAIIQHTRVKPTDWWGRLIAPPGGFDDPRLPVRPTDRDRLSRYEIAADLHPVHTDPKRHEIRRIIGEQLVQAWKLGKFDKTCRIGNLFVFQPRRARRNGARATA